MVFLLMIIDRIDIAGMAALEAKDDAPVARDRHRPIPPELALERMEPKARQTHIADLDRGIEARKDSPDLVGMFRRNPASVVVLEEARQTLVAEAADYSRSV
jgi:hypothetical protein